jgi:membrane protease YdiL (CAAX protease family)
MSATTSNWFRWQPTRETALAVAAGLAVIGLSGAMVAARDIVWLSIVLRDEAMILGVGILLPLIYIRRSGAQPADFGLSLRRWPLLLPINLGLAGLLLLEFIRGNPPPDDFRLDAAFGWKAAFVMEALVFELVFFYAFMRTLLERAFGILPAIVLTALFYSFHHVGFEPEFGKLFLVGLLYAGAYRLGRSALVIFPFFLGVGGIYDVLVQGRNVAAIPQPEVRSLVLAAGIVIIAILTFKKTTR